MGCERITFPGGFGYACSRGGRRAAPCDTPGCGKAHVALCDWPLGGAKKGRTCDRKMCADCRVPQGENRDYCRAHAALAEAPAEQQNAVAVVGARDFRALHLVRDHVLGLEVAVGCLVSGHARGTDIVAEITAHQRGLVTSIHAVRTKRGEDREAFTAAAMARNGAVADEARSADVFVTKDCRGSWDAVRKFQALGKEVRLHEEPGPDEHSLLFHTAPHPRTRQAPRGYDGPDGFDITRGSGGAAGDPFAPSAALFMEAKRRMALEGPGAFAWYSPLYVEEMRGSWLRHRRAWDALLARNHVVLLCYCPARELCHRGLLVELLLKAGARVGRRVVDGGEVLIR